MSDYTNPQYKTSKQSGYIAVFILCIVIVLVFVI